MNSNKSFSSETSERYALALYELASENSELENIENNSKTFLKIYNSNSDLKIFIKNPTESISNQLITLNKISDSLNLSIIFKKFLSILVVKRRIFFLKNILTKFLSLSLKNRGEIKADLVSSKNLSNQELDNLNSELSKIIGSKVNFSYKVDDSLIGGMSLQLGSLMIDTSVKNKLKKYEKVLLEV